MAKGNKKTIALTEEQYTTIIKTMMNGSSLFRANKKIATALVLEANLGIRISDIVQLKLNSIVQDGERYRLDITEEKTQKKRTFTVPQSIYDYIKSYCYDLGIKQNEYLFPSSSGKNKPITPTAIQKHLRVVCDYLDLKDLNISTHSFRKFYATRIYINNNYNIVLVQRLLQHSKPDITQRYIGIETKELEQAIENNSILL